MSTAVIIPFHHRMDLLDKLLVCIQEFRIVIVDDGPNASNFSSYAHVHVLRSEGNRGFTQAVNIVGNKELIWLPLSMMMRLFLRKIFKSCFAWHGKQKESFLL
jgi:glycosyltransferase involved in cell wall biosynthesis